MSLRGGYGIGYERNFGNVTFNVMQNPPNAAVISVINGTDVPQGNSSRELGKGAACGSESGVPCR